MAGSFASVVFATGVFGCTTGQLLIGGLDDGGGPELDGQTSPEIDSGYVGDAPVDNDAAPDGYVGPCFISASDYDQSCSVDTDCTGAGFVCACPSHVTLSTTGGSTTCSTNPEGCSDNQGQCVMGSCRDQVAAYHSQLCTGASDLVACQTDLGPCSIAGEECKTLACVDSTEGAQTDNRVTVIR